MSKAGPSPAVLRVLHVMTRHMGRGGSEKAVADWLHTELARGWDVHLALGGHSDPEATRTIPERVVVHHLPHLIRQPSPVDDLRGLGETRSLLHNLRCDVVHTHQSKAGIVGRVAASLERTSVLLHSVHMAPFGPGYPPLMSRLQEAAERRLARRTDAILFVGEELRRQWVAGGIVPGERTVHMPSAVSVERFLATRGMDDAACRALRSEYGLPQAGRLVVIASALEPRKRVPLAVSRLARLLSEPGWTLAVAGTGPQAVDVVAAAEAAGVAASVHLLGHVTDISRLFACADVLVLSSTIEGVPQVVIQALAAGLPVAACQVEGLRELDGAPVFVGARDGSDLAERCLEAFAAPHRALPAEAFAAWSSVTLEANRHEVLHRVEWTAKGRDRLHRHRRGLHADSGPRQDVVMYMPSARGGHPAYVQALLAELSPLLEGANLRGRLLTSTDLDPGFHGIRARVERDLPPLRHRSEFQMPLHWAASRAVHYLQREAGAVRWLEAQGDSIGVVHLQELAPWAGIRTIQRIRRTGARVVCTVHNVYSHGADSSVRLRLADRLAKRQWRSCDVLITHTPALRDQLAKRLGRQHPPIAVTEHGVWTLSSTTSSRDAPHPTARLLCPGVLRSTKGAEVLLRAMPSIHGAELLIAGDAVDAGYLAGLRLLAAPLGDRVRLQPAWISQSALEAMLENCDVVVLPYTQFAAQSGSLFLAIAAGRPVVVSDVGGLPETVRALDLGAVARAGDPVSLASAIREILVPERYAVCAAAAERARASDRGFARMATATMQVYRSVLNLETRLVGDSGDETAA